jgi:hypothetical protein
MTDNLSEVLENEWYIVRYSGETPEIAYNSAIYQLSRAKDGPRICLTDDQLMLLKNAATDRFAEIVLRDLQHANSTRSIYRGIGRSIINYRRFCTFCSRQQLNASRVRSQAAEALPVFLKTEIKQLQAVNRPTIINCTYVELQSFARELGVELDNTCTVLAELCPTSS